MGQLCIYLPPFASDYSGVCSALFDLDCLIAIDDAACCTVHYVFCDEPRWSQQVKPVVSTALRTVDAVLGNDEKTIARICEASAHIDTQLIALMGTPVPAIIGMDTAGMASEIEARTGKPALGFDTSGFNYYDKGIFMAGKALIERFAREDVEPLEGRLNILGMTPLDYGARGNDTALVQLLENAGWQVGCRAFMGLTLEQIENIGNAQVNLAVSAAGVKLAQLLERRFGTPYVAGFPTGGTHTQLLLAQLKSAAKASTSTGTLSDAVCDSCTNPAPNAYAIPASDDHRRQLVIGDQVIANSLREALELAGAACTIDVASFFGWSKPLARGNDIHLKDEASYLRLLRSGAYHSVIADPLILDVPDAQELHTMPLVHPAVSSKLHWDDAPQFLASTFERTLLETWKD